MEQSEGRFVQSFYIICRSIIKRTGNSLTYNLNFTVFHFYHESQDFIAFKSLSEKDFADLYVIITNFLYFWKS